MSSRKAFFAKSKLNVAIVAALVVVVGIGFFIRNSETAGTSGECRINKTSEILEPLARGEVAAFSVAKATKAFPMLKFLDVNGKEITLASFRGKTVLLNLWATWCVPCRKEMPSLDRLEADLGSKDFQVIALNVDTSDAEKPKKWLIDNGIKNLAFYSDTKGEVLKTLQKSGHVVGLPTTMLLNSEGCLSGILQGEAEWASTDAITLIQAAIRKNN